MRAPHPFLGLYLKKLGECTQGGARHNGQVDVGKDGAQEPLALGRPQVGRPLGGPPGAPLWPGASSMVMFFENMVHGQKFARKDVQIIFPKGFKTQNIFGIFVKRKKLLEKKFQHAENNFENFKHAVGKNK